MSLAVSYTWAFRGRRRMDFEVIVNVLLKAATVVITLGLLTAGSRVAGVIVAQSLAGAIALVLALHLYGRLQLTTPRPSVSTARELVRGAAPIFTMGLAISFQPYVVRMADTINGTRYLGTPITFEA